MIIDRVKKHTIFIISINIFVSHGGRIAGNVFASQNSNQSAELEYSHRENRMEGINPPTEVGGADIQIEAAYVNPVSADIISHGDIVELRFFRGEGERYIVDVKEKALNYLMRPDSSAIVNGTFNWPANAVLLPCIKENSLELRYKDLLPIAYRNISTPRYSYVSPIMLFKSGKYYQPQSYRFLFKTTADIEIFYTFYRQVNEEEWIIAKDKVPLAVKAMNSFLIEWDLLLGNGEKAPYGQYLLKLEGGASRGPNHESVKAECFFNHKIIQ